MHAMTLSMLTLPDDPKDLKTLIMEVAAKHTVLEETVDERETLIAEQAAEITWLRQQLQLLRQKRFGSSSEKLSEEQLLLMLEGDRTLATVPEPPETIAVHGHRRAKGGRRPLPEGLERIEVLHDLSPEEKICPRDGHPLKRIGEETSEQLSCKPAEMRVLLHVRPKYACPVCEEGVVIAPPPAQLIPKSMASPSLLAQIAVSKYADALPLYRQEQIFQRQGVDLLRSTMSSWMIHSGEGVQPLINLLRDELLEGFCVQCDETRFQVLKEQGREAQSQSYLWAQRGGTPQSPVILFDYAPSRGGEVPKRLLEGHEGYLQVDGYKGYDALCREHPEIRRVGCMAHARRKFDEAFKVLTKKGKKGKSRKKAQTKSKAFEGLTWIGKLYEVERDARGMSAEERHRLRQTRARPILDAMEQWRKDAVGQVPPKTLIGLALGYLSDQWEYLIRYLEDGRLEIDNNLVENAIRPFCLGRRNWLFSDTVRGAEASANLYSLIVTAKANGLEPHAYLSLVFRDLPRARSVEDYERLLPTHWTKEAVQADLAMSEIPI